MLKIKEEATNAIMTEESSGAQYKEGLSRPLYTQA